MEQRQKPTVLSYVANSRSRQAYFLSHTREHPHLLAWFRMNHYSFCKITSIPQYHDLVELSVKFPQKALYFPIIQNFFFFISLLQEQIYFTSGRAEKEKVKDCIKTKVCTIWTCSYYHNSHISIEQLLSIVAFQTCFVHVRSTNLLLSKKQKITLAQWTPWEKQVFLIGYTNQTLHEFLKCCILKKWQFKCLKLV